MTATTTPCIEPTCRTRGGHIPRGMARPWRGRGYCRRCYGRYYAQGAFEHDKLRAYSHKCYPSNARPEYMVWHTHEGERHAHPLPFHADYDRAAVEAEAEAFAAQWLAAHPEHVARYAAAELAA